MKTTTQIWITRGHLRALAASSLGLAFLAFFVGVEVGRSGAGQAKADTLPRLLPDAQSDDALEALLQEVEAAQRSKEGEFQAALAEVREPPPAPPVAGADAAPEVEPVPVVEAPPEEADVPVVAIPAPPTAAVAEASPRPTGGWAVQIASYHTPEEAKAKVDELVALGQPAYQIAAMVGGRTWHRVRVGGFATKDAANDGRIQLMETLQRTDLVVAAAP